MHLGIESYIGTPKPKLVNVSLESIMTDYVACEAYCSHLDKFCRFANELSTTMNNIRDIARTISKHHSTEALATITDLFKDLNGHVSVESLKEKASAAWAKLKEWFNKAGAAIAGFWRRFLALFTKVEKRLEVYKTKLKGLDSSKYEVREWSYNGYIATNYTKLVEEQKKKEGDTWDYSYTTPKINVGKHTVAAGADKAVAVIDAILKYIADAKAGETEQKQAYAIAKQNFSNAVGMDNIQAAQREIDHVKLFMGVWSKHVRTAAKTAASILSNCRVYRKSAA